MEVIFETPTGEKFELEIWYYDTVSEIKKKIEKYHGIPINRQTLVFNGNLMSDDKDTEFYGISLCSRIQLHVDSSDSEKKPIKIEEESSSKLNLTIKIPSSKRHFILEAESTDTVNQLKERIQESEAIPLNRIALFVAGGIELQDQNGILAEYGITEQSEINVVVKQYQQPQQQQIASATAAAGSLKKLKLMILPKGGTRKIPVEVNASDNVGELKKELQRLQHQLQFHLPQEGYFFIYKQNVMEDERNFRWHDVRQGDTIEIFNGSVTGGS